MLQDQYSSDFKHISKNRMAEIKGRSNYTCVHSQANEDAKKQELTTWTCADGPGSQSADACPSCPYKMARNQATNAQIALMNTAYYMAVKNGRSFGGRKVLVIDEGHSLADYVLAQCEIKISNWTLKRLFTVLDASVPSYKTLKEYDEWLDEIWTACSDNISTIRKEIQGLDAEELVKMPLFKQKMRELEAFKGLQDKIGRYRKNKDIKWVWDFVEDKDNQARTHFVLKPLDISRFAESNIFASLDKVILMSATFLSKKEICEELGLDGSNTQWIECDSPFPAEHHRFMTSYVGSLNFKEIDKTLPKISVLIRHIMSFHPEEKGIIHCLSEDTLVMLSDGSEKPIKELEVGEEVISLNADTECHENKTIQQVYNNGYQQCYLLEFDNGIKIECTENHKFLSRNRGWITAGDISSNDELISFYNK